MTPSTRSVPYEFSVAPITFSSTGGTKSDNQSVTIATATTAAKIYYTADGTIPTASSTLYLAPITIRATTTLQAIAIKAGYMDSSVKQSVHILTAAQPTFSPDGGDFLNELTKTVTLSCATSGATLYYTIDGSDPTSNTTTTVGSGGTITLASSATLKVMAIKTGYANSTIKSATFTLGRLKADTTIEVAGGMFNNGTSEITVSPFWISPYEVTQGDYQVVIGSNPSDLSRGIGGNYPVNKVSWYDAVEYCNALSIAKGLTPCYTINKTTQDPNNNNSSDTSKWTVTCESSKNGYRLPTDAEWHFAARGGTSSNGYTYSGSNTIDNVAWYINNSDLKSHEIGTKAANELGIYDMSGNLWEWCWDWYLYPYPSEAQIDPQGSSSGSDRVVRGGGWDNSSSICTVSNLSNYGPYLKNHVVGFRLVRRP